MNNPTPIQFGTPLLLAILLLSCENEQLPPAPVAIAGENKESLTYSSIPLDGSQSFSNIHADSLKFEWSIIESPTASNPTIDNPELKKTLLNVDIAGNYVVALRVTDKEDQFDSDSITVVVIDRFISLDSTIVNPTPSSGEISIVVTSNVSWTAFANVEWVTIHPSAGNSSTTEVKITWSYNPYLMSRMAVVTFSAPHTETKVFEVNQQGPFLSVSTNHIDASNQQGSQLVTVAANTGWVAFVTIGHSWLSTSGGINGFTVNWTENTTGFDRIGNIQVMGAESYVHTIEVHQSK